MSTRTTGTARNTGAARTTQIFYASTLYGVATLAAALDSGCFGPADRRLLLLANNAAVPETAVAPDGMEGFERLRDRFDRVLSWNEAISPLHPSGWTPRPDDVPLLERHLRKLWDLGDDRLELAVESVQVTPALSIAQLFPDAALDVYADGLMSYGPTRNKIDPLVGERVRRLFHLDLVPGLAPLLLAEFGAAARVVPAEAFTKVIAELAGPPAAQDETGPVLLLGQYLAALSLLTPAEEESLHLRMVRGAVALGHRRLAFKPHPTAPQSWTRALREEAERLGAELTVVERPVLAEVLYRELRPALVVGCFSTALLTASTFYGLPVARIGTDTLLERLSPYENSNRVPVTIVDALLPDLADPAAVAAWAPPSPATVAGELAGLVGAVGFAMQPQVRADLRPVAEAYLAGGPSPAAWRYFTRRRLTVLGLPGGLPVPRHAAVRRLARSARRLKRAALRRMSR
ncbi:alpha-2,8-polysialyltransferase family protein [Streptomyces solicathayae]|uniref:Alpha-2,8-polysialyltransferase family protein n=1 Tax=Streptomyces solicathayae TaxID=3081768 RepID=A0ABZ0LSQ6_9ACTN|nr:alpha-2,8-polysialyltransferase family protein [Streptomyces sp. HUAS YS2]WOX22524.1 alpha-2,8-polysialyltransferase family protein [Streptomyces sp. HUAS YS2]